MRIVADTNIVVSAFLWGGAPKALLSAAREQRITLFTSAMLMAELEDVLTRPKFARRFEAIGSSPTVLLDRYLNLARFVIPAALDPVISRDPDDDHVLACARTAHADLIVSGDDHLLSLGHFQTIPVVTVNQALAMIEGTRDLEGMAEKPWE